MTATMMVKKAFCCYYIISEKTITDHFPETW